MTDLKTNEVVTLEVDCKLPETHANKNLCDCKGYRQTFHATLLTTDHSLKALDEALDIKSALHLPDEALPMLFKDRLIEGLAGKATDRPIHD